MAKFDTLGIITEAKLLIFTLVKDKAKCNTAIGTLKAKLFKAKSEQEAEAIYTGWKQSNGL